MDFSNKTKILILNRRPIMFVALFLMLGITCEYYFNLNKNILLIMLCIAIISIILLLIKSINFILIPLLIATFTGGSLLFCKQFQSVISNLNLSEEYTIEGRVINISHKDYYSVILDKVKLISESGSEYILPKKVLINTKEKLYYGDIISFSGKINEPSAPRNPGAFDSRMYLTSNGIAFSCFTYNVSLLGHNDEWYFFPFKIRDYVEKQIDKFFTPQQASIAKAMVLGVKSDLPDEMKEEFSKTGISHVLAISGLHITFISALLNGVLKKISINRGYRFSINIILLIFYMIMTGFSSSVVRAVIISVCIIIGRWGFYKRDLMTYLSVALMITLLMNTARLFMPGFLMSYGVFFGLLCLDMPFNSIFEKLNFQNYFSKLLSASLAASIAVLPLTAYFFKGITLIAPIANFYAIPLTIIIVIFTGLFTILSFIPGIAALLSVIPQIASQLLLTFNHFFSISDIGYIPVEGFNIDMGILIYMAMFLISGYILIGFKKKIIITVCICMFTGFYWNISIKRINDYILKLIFLDVGTGDDIHIKLPDKNYLIDNGGNAQYSNLTKYTEDNGIIYDAVIVSNDKTKNLEDIIDNGFTYKLWVPHNYIKKKYDESIDLEYYAFDEIIPLNNNTILKPIGYDKKHYSFLLLLNDVPICLLGQNDANDIILSDNIPIIKLANGGDKDSLNVELIRNINPEKFIISVKDDNKQGLPDASVLELIKNCDTPLYTTGANGAIILTVSKSGKTSIETMKGDQ